MLNITCTLIFIFFTKTMLTRIKWVFIAAAVVATVSCSTTKFVPDGEYLLRSTKVRCDNSTLQASVLDPYIRQRPNSKWFSLAKVPLGIYNMSGRDSTKWINKVVRRLGEAPVIYDSVAAIRTCHDMEAAMRSMGYLQATTEYCTVKRIRKAHVEYTLHPGKLFLIDSVKYDIQDIGVGQTLGIGRDMQPLLHRGTPFSTDNLDGERKRISQKLLDNGYFKFNKDFVHYDADSTGKGDSVDVTLRLIKYRASNNSPETSHSQYRIGNVRYISGDGSCIPLRPKVMQSNNDIMSDSLFSATNLQNTYNNFSRLVAVKFTNIHFEERPDTNLLDCDIQISMRKPNSISFQPEGTNTAGDLGAAVSLTYENNNLFRGSEQLSVQLRGAFEAISGLEGYQAQDYEEYNIEAKLAFPRIIAPFISRRLGRRKNMQSELLFGYNLQNRPEFHRRLLTGAWRYHWKSVNGRSQYRLDLLDVNYVHMPWISATFKKEYLDDATNRNAILRYNYEDLFILRTGVNYVYNNGVHAVRSNLEIGGNLLNGISHILGSRRNDNSQYTLFNIAFAQYVKGDFDYTRLINIDRKNTLAMHVGLGVAYPYGNSKVLPFEKRYFSGGSNSVRGWSVRALGPGKFKGTDGRIDFINQTGDMKLDINVELRTFLFWKFNGALFVDAGNIWTLKDYEEQPGGLFKFSEFYKQMAVAYGVGLRLNLDYFVMRLDFGMKAVNPAYNNTREHYPITSPNFGRDLAVHFAVGMPF